MAVVKKSEEKKPAAKEEVKETLAQKLDKINFSNKQAKDISDLQSENKRLKDMVGRKKMTRPQNAAVRIAGLQTLGQQVK